MKIRSDDFTPQSIGDEDWKCLVDLASMMVTEENLRQLRLSEHDLTVLLSG